LTLAVRARYESYMTPTSAEIKDGAQGESVAVGAQAGAPMGAQPPESAVSPFHPAMRPFHEPYFFLVMGIALAARFVVFAICWNGPDIFEAPLTPRYMTLASNLLTQLRFSEDALGVKLSAQLPPLFPAFLAVEKLVMGDVPHSFAHAQALLGTLVLAQALLGTLICGLVYALAHAILGRPGALIAGLLSALDPVCVITSLRVSHEALYVALLTAAAWALVQAFTHDYVWAWALGGVAGAAAALAWDDALWFWIPVALGVVFWRGSGFGRRLARLGVFAALFALVAGAWCGRNYLVLGHWTFALDSDRRWLENRHAALVVETKNVSRDSAVAALKAEVSQGRKEGDMPDWEWSRRARSQAMRALLSHPGFAAQLWAGGAQEALLNPETHVSRILFYASFPSGMANSVLWGAYYFLFSAFQEALLLLIVVGAFHHRSWRAGLVWWGPVVYLLYFLPFLADLDADADFRFVLTPALFVLAAREGLCYWPWLARRFKYAPERFGKVAYSGPVIVSDDDGGGLL